MAKGYNQREGVNFIYTFSLVAKLTTISFMRFSKLVFSAQLDINNAFLNGGLFEEVYMYLPLGYDKQEEHKQTISKRVCKLHKSIYGLKQASRQWNITFT